MPPIPVYANVPLHAEGATSKTTAQEVEPQPEPTRTTASVKAPVHQFSSPPPPQPGARPAAPTGTTSFFCDPPAPHPSDAPHPHHVTETHVTTTTAWQQPLQPPSQFSLPTPIRNYAPTHSTSAGVPQPSPFEAGRADISRETGGSIGGGRSLEHPPGYVQNPYAADGTAQDRARIEHAQQEANEEEGVLGTVKSYLGGAGSALKKAEESVWGLAKGLGK